MKKKIIALAVAGLMSGAAFAQTNVTVYGVADVTFDNVKATGASDLLVDIGTGPGDVASTYTNLNQPSRNRVSANSSYLGFKGVEDLGGGLKAVFQFEGGVANDNAGAFNFNRDSFVGVAGGFGTVAAGILTGPTRALGAAMEPFSGATGITANTALIGKLGGFTLAGVNPYYTFPATAGNDNTIANAQAALAGTVGYCATSGTCTSIFDTRWNNAIAYISPNMGGLTVTAAYVANENKTRSDIVNELNTRGYDLGLRYENGPIMAGLTYNKASLGDIDNLKVADTRLAGKFNGGNWTVGLLYDRVKLSGDGGSATRNAWFIPVTFNVTAAGKIVAQYGQAGDVTDSSDTGAKMFAIGYEHSLSKRTIVKVVYSQINNEASAVYDFGVNSVGGIMAGADPKGFQVGVRHSF